MYGVHWEDNGVADGVNWVDWDMDWVDRMDGEMEEGVDGVLKDSAFLGGDFTWVLGVEFVGVGAGSLGASEGHLEESDLAVLINPWLVSIVAALEQTGVAMLVGQELSVGVAT